MQLGLLALLLTKQVRGLWVHEREEDPYLEELVVRPEILVQLEHHGPEELGGLYLEELGVHLEILVPLEHHGPEEVEGLYLEELGVHLEILVPL